MRKKMSIPEPKAKRNETVMVYNYRRKNIWQEGEVLSLEYRNSFGGWSWVYDVLVYGKNGKPYRLYVGDDKIKPLFKKNAKRGKGE